MTDKQQQEIALIVETTPVVILQDAKQKAALFAHIEQEIAEFVPDLTTDKGRKAIASLAFRVSKTKTAIDEAREGLIADARKVVNGVNEEWKGVRIALDNLRDKARAPLTAWEKVEAIKAENTGSQIAWFKDIELGYLYHPSGGIQDKISEIRKMEFDPDEYGEDNVAILELHRADALDKLAVLVVKRVKEEQDAAELAILRRKEQERAEADAEKARKEKEEADAKAEQERKEAWERKKEEEQKATEKAAEERATLAAKEEAQKAQDALAAQHAAEQKAKQDEIDRLENEKRQRKEEEEANHKAAALRQADRDHRGKIMGEVKADLIKVCALDPAVAHIVVLAIVANNIKNTAITF